MTHPLTLSLGSYQSLFSTYDANENHRSGGLTGRTELLSMLPIQDMASPEMFWEKSAKFGILSPHFPENIEEICETSVRIAVRRIEMNLVPLEFWLGLLILLNSYLQIRLVCALRPYILPKRQTPVCMYVVDLIRALPLHTQLRRWVDVSWERCLKDEAPLDDINLFLNRRSAADFYHQKNVYCQKEKVQFTRNALPYRTSVYGVCV
jgi:hypothetical protein